MLDGPCWLRGLDLANHHNLCESLRVNFEESNSQTDAVGDA